MLQKLQPVPMSPEQTIRARIVSRIDFGTKTAARRERAIRTLVNKRLASMARAQRKAATARRLPSQGVVYPKDALLNLEYLTGGKSKAQLRRESKAVA